jgi:hypothetical protein
MLSSLISKPGDHALKLEKMKKKCDMAKLRALHLRNDYLLNIQSVDALTQKYYQTTLPTLLKQIDGEYFTNIQNFLVKFLANQKEYAENVNFFNARIEPKITAISQDVETAGFFSDNKSIYTSTPPIPFEKFGLNTDDKIVNSNDDSALAQKYSASNLTLDTVRRDIAKNEKEVLGLENMIKVYSKTPDFGNANNPKEVTSL